LEKREEMSTDQKSIIANSLADADLFARAVLRLDLHDWQGKILYKASQLGQRRRIAVRSPNGSGKDDRIIAPLALWWLRRYRRGQVVITTADEKQLSNQTWTSLSAHRHLFGDCPTWRDHDHTIATPTGGRLSAWVTDEAARAEGYHQKQPDGPLLMIINEAKSVDDSIFDAFNRCSYNLLLEISTGGLMQGRFYSHMTHQRELYETFEITLHDCPHIAPEKVAQIIQEYGENDPYTRSTIYGEFMATDDTIRHVLELKDIEGNRQAQIGRLGGDVGAGVDFAAGGDQNVVVKKVGNYVPNNGIKAWRERDTYAAVGRYVAYFNELELQAEQIWADADGLGLPMVDQLAAMGWKVNRFYGGSASPHSRYRNLISWGWHEVAQKVRKHQIIVPDNQTLIAQLSSRRVKYAQDGRLWLENKPEMRERGVGSPDLADAFVMAFAMQPFKAYPWVPVTNNWPEIAKRQGWQYSGDSSEEEYDDSFADRRNWNRQPADDSATGFGGCHSVW
jgi:phage terminase large subunit